MDTINRAIIGHLLRDGRATFAEVGETVGLSAPAVKRRVDQMRARGEISGFTVLVDAGAMGWTVEAYVEIFCRGNVPPEMLREAITGIAEVVELVTVTGESDAMARVMANSVTDIQAIVEEIRQSPHIDRTKTEIVLSRVIDRPYLASDPE